jgi:hypothetical protein
VTVVCQWSFFIVIPFIKAICHGELVEPLAALLGLRQAQTDMSRGRGNNRTIQISGLLLIAMVTVVCQWSFFIIISFISVEAICHGELVEPLAALLGLRQAQTDMWRFTIQISGLLLIAMVTLLCQ